jgi:hypothetical protein
MYVLTASQAYQAALESRKVGHGYLTYSLVQALETPLTDIKPVDGRISAIEWFEHAAREVPKLQLSLRQSRPSQKDRVLTPVKTEEADALQNAGSATSLQTPRLYYRRDDTTPAPVIAKRRGEVQ